MSEQEKGSAEKIAQAISELSPEYQKYLQGYAEGVAEASKNKAGEQREEGGESK